jgi:hypothetical protein
MKKALPQSFYVEYNSINPFCKTFAKISLVLTFAFFATQKVQAQFTSNSYVTSNAAGFMEDMTGSTILQQSGSFGTLDGGKDEVASKVHAIGFDFWFMGVRQTQFSANTNGAILLGATEISSTEYPGSSTSFPRANRSVIAPFLADMATAASTGKVHYKVFGVAPNRRLVVEFLNMRIKYNSSAATGSFQAVLHERVGIIDFNYSATFKVGGSASFQANVGFYSNNTSGRIKTIAHVSPYTENNSSPVTTISYNIPSATIGLQNKRIRFFPPVPNNIAGALSFSVTSATSSNLSWADVANDKGYVIYHSLDNTNFYFLGQTATNVVNFTATRLKPNATNYFRVFAVTEGAQSLTPLSGSVNTTSCPGGTTPNIAIISTEGVNTYPAADNTYNWSALTWSAGNVPNACQDAEIILDVPTSTKHERININIDVPDVVVNSLKITNRNASATFEKHISVESANANLTILGDLTISAPGGNIFNRAVLGNAGRTTIYGNTSLGSAVPAATHGHGAIGSGGNSNMDCWYTFYGDLIFNPRGYTTDERATFEFVKNGDQLITNNTLLTDTVEPVLFEDIRIGNGTSATQVIFNGNQKDGYMEVVGRRGVTVFEGSTLTLAEGYSLNRITSAGSPIGSPSSLILKNNSRLRLAGHESRNRDGAINGVAGSNFPSYFSPIVFETNSTVEYCGYDGNTQTIYSAPSLTYRNLEATATGVFYAGIGRAKKNTTDALNVIGNFNIKGNTDVTLGNAVAQQSKILTVETNGGLYCGTNTVSGASTFTMQDGSYLGLGDANGITPVGTAAGNIQTTVARNYNTTGNYIYNGAVAQVTGTGLPANVNEFTVDNASGVTNTNNLTISGNLYLKNGISDIGSKQITLASNSEFNVTGGIMKADNGIVDFEGSTNKSVSGNWFVNSTLATLINDNVSGITVAALPAATLNIKTALLFGTGRTNSTIASGNNLTLLSRSTGTARMGEIVAASGNAVIGDVSVERWVGTSRKWRMMAWNTNSAQTARQSIMEGALTSNANPNANYGTIVTDEQVTWNANGFDSRSISGPSLKYYNPSTNTFIGVPNVNSYAMNSKSAYFNFVRGDRTALPSNAITTETILRQKGSLKTGIVTFNVLPGKFEMIGNPYASSVDLRNVTTTGGINTFYVWDPKLTGAFGLGAYQLLTKSGVNFTVMPGGGSYPAAGSVVNEVESGQGFMVRANAGGGDVTFEENDKVAAGSNVYSRGAGTSQAEILYSLLSIVENGTSTLVDGAMGAYDNSYSSAVDYDDALKLVNTSENVSFKRNNTLLSIERRSDIVEDDSLHLNVTGYRLKTYNWELRLANMVEQGRTAFLVDRYTNTTTPIDLNGTTNYQFTMVNVPAAYAANRFVIVFKQIPAPKAQFAIVKATRKANKTIDVNWAMVNEVNIANYTIEQSNDGINFVGIADKTADANNGTNASYLYNEATASVNKNWYRIKFTTTSGLIKYSTIVFVNAIEETTNNSEVAGIRIYPNPVENGNVNLYFTGQQKGMYNVSVITQTGATLFSSQLQINNTTEKKQIKVDNAATGHYNLVLVNEAGNKTVLPIVIK